jgi:hypothetical protein
MEQDVPQQQQQQDQQQFMQHRTTTAAAPGLETISVDINAVKISVTREREWQPGALLEDGDWNHIDKQSLTSWHSCVCVQGHCRLLPATLPNTSLIVFRPNITLLCITYTLSCRHCACPCTPR